MLEGDGRIEELAAVGEGVRGDVEDAHDDGAVLRQQAAEHVRQAAASHHWAADGPYRQANLCRPVIVMASRFARRRQGGVKRCA